MTQRKCLTVMFVVVFVVMMKRILAALRAWMACPVCGSLGINLHCPECMRE
jgi:hypothetical protein